MAPSRIRTRANAARPRAALGKKLAAIPAGDLSRLSSEIGALIEGARARVALTVNEALTTLYWEIGARIRRDVLGQKRAEYGAEIVSALGRQLESRFGRGFDEKSLRHMLRFAEAFEDPAIVRALRTRRSHGSLGFSGGA